MRLLSFKIKLFLCFKCVLFDFPFAEEWHRKFTSAEVQSRFDQVDAALMTLEVVQAEKQIDLVVLQHGKRALDRLIAPDQVHVCQVDSAKNFRLPDTNRHPSKPGIKLVEQIALLGTLFTDNRALGATVDESLHWVAVHLRVDVEHGDITEELRVVLHGLLVVSADHLLPDLFFDHFLRFHIVRVRVSHLHLALLLSLLLGHDFFEPICDQFFNLGMVSRIQRREKLGVAAL